MSIPNQPTLMVARRQIGFLSTFDKKFEGFRREMERLRRASSTGKAFGGRWPTEGLERTARSLVGAGAVYGLPEITDWARLFLNRLDAIRTSQSPPSADDMDWLGARIGELEELQRGAVENAQAVLEPGRGVGSEAKPSRSPEGARDSKPFIAPSTTTDPPPPPAQPHLSGQPALAARVEQKQGTTPPATSPVAQTARAKEEEPLRETLLPSVGRLTLHEMPASRASASEPLRSLVLLGLRDSTTAGKIQFTLKNAGFEVKKVSSLERISQEAIEESPELVVVDLDEESPGGAAAIGALTSDPLTDYIPLLRIGTVSGPARSNVVPKPVNGERLVAECRRLVSPDVHMARITIGLKDPNLEELVNFVCEELRAGILDSAVGGASGQRFSLASEARLMASIWGLVAQMRQAAGGGSRGRIRFLPATSGQMGMMALAQAEEVLDATGQTELDDVALASLAGIRVLVADDDPEIRVVFERVLHGAGVTVITAADGLQALETVREVRPDVVITDILMPGMDGWELCNRIRQDYALRHIPVIMISWKEDFLERLRGLNVDADGFMLKEVDRNQILARVARVLKPRFVLRGQLRIDGDVLGRIERVGVMTVLESAVSDRPDCRVTFRESWNYFEVDFRDGQLVAVTRTGSDGSFASGPPALERLLGVTSGRFAVVEATETARRQFKDGTDQAIRAACRRLNSMVAQITDGAMLDIAQVELDEDVVALYTQIMPPKLRGALDRLVAKESPREIILSHETSPDALEAFLLDLVRVGAVRVITAPPPDLARAPVSRDSARWRAIADGSPVGDLAPPPPPPLPPPPPQQPSGPPSVIPLPDELLEEIPATDDAPIGGRALDMTEVAPTQGARAISKGWRVAALLAFAALCASAYFNYLNWDRGRKGEGPPAQEGEAVEVEIPTAPTELFAPAPAPIAVPDAAVPQEPVAAVSDAGATAPIDVAPLAEPALEEPAGHAIEAEADDDRDEEEEARERRRRKKRRAEREAAAAAATGEGASAGDKKAASDMGTLTVVPPADAPGPVTVSVDGKPRGTAPVTTTLAPGLHELSYTIDGKRTLRMVSIKAGETKRVTAKVAQ